LMINSAPLRLLLADATACGQVEDYDVTVALTLDSSTLESNVTDCTFAGATQREPFPTLLELVKRY
jgi:hypothetical protein